MGGVPGSPAGRVPGGRRSRRPRAQEVDALTGKPFFVDYYSLHFIIISVDYSFKVDYHFLKCIHKYVHMPTYKIIRLHQQRFFSDL